MWPWEAYIQLLKKTITREAASVTVSGLLPGDGILNTQKGKGYE